MLLQTLQVMQSLTYLREDSAHFVAKHDALTSRLAQTHPPDPDALSDEHVIAEAVLAAAALRERLQLLDSALAGVTQAVRVRQAALVSGKRTAPHHCATDA